MSSNTSGTAPQGGDRSVVPGTEQAEHARDPYRPTSIALIKPQTIGVLGDNPEKFTLVIKSKGGDTLKETKWDTARGGWPVGIVQIQGLETENLSVELRKERLASVIRQKIASGSLTMKEVVAAINASQDHIEIWLSITSHSSLSADDKKLVLVVEISMPSESLLPVWITSISLAESTDGVTDRDLENLDLLFESEKGKTLKESSWDSFHRNWAVGLPQLRGAATEHLTIKLRGRGRTGRRKTLATVTLNIKESEEARNDSRKEITKVFTIPRNSGLNTEELALAIQIGAFEMPEPDTDRVVLPRSVAQILENTSVITEVLETLSGVNSTTELGWLVVSAPLKMLQSKLELDNKLVDLVDSMNQLYGCAIVKDALKNYETFQILFDAMIQQSVECFLFISNYISDGYFRHMITVSGKIDRFKSSFENLKSRFDNELLRTNTVATMATKDLVVGLHDSMQHIDTKLDLHDMKRVLEEELGTTQFRLPSDLPRCLLGTRQHTLSKILDWIVRGKQSLLWLSGVAGSGKSSIMATLHDYLDEMGYSSHLAAYIRFRRSLFESPSKFVQALIYQLASFDTRLGVEIAKAMKGKILHSPLSRQLQSLLIQPLKKHKPTTGEETQIVILIDGLDECMQEAGGSSAFHELLALLSHLASSDTFHSFPFLRFIVASRPEEPIHTAFTKSLTPDDELDDVPNVLHFRLDTSSSETTADILKYLSFKFGEIFRKNNKFRELCKRENAVPRLADSSHGLFIWAYVVSRFLGDFPSEERLQSALDMTIPKDAPGGVVLGNLYTTVLNGVAAEHGDEDVKSHNRSLLGLVIAVGRVKALHEFLPGLTKITLHGLLQLLTDKVDEVLSLLPRLGAVIEGAHSPDEELFLLHKSLEDYLTDRSRAGEAWYIDLKGCWIPKVAEFCICMVHSNVFSDTPEISDVSSFANQYWTSAFLAQLDSNRPFPSGCEHSRIFLEILQQGLLRWVYCVRNYRHAGSDARIFARTGYGLYHIRDTIKQTPEIVDETANTLVERMFWSPDIPASPSFDLQTLFIYFCRYPEGAPTLRKYYLPQFSNIASGSRDFFTILEAIESVGQDFADLLSRLKSSDAVAHDSDADSMVSYISGVPSDVVLRRMYDGLHDTGRLDLDLYQLPYVSDEEPDEQSDEESDEEPEEGSDEESNKESTRSRL
ncbi:hypothetical protein V5O48_009961 [Marasmius crinis-equi]|uniref:Nephrocystin 3-like N-terminal domain-containing protein n=1 Tax=Marasmius crinis-equi TaxID=585013 RepID=A0ABR3F9P3_9AGAR